MEFEIHPPKEWIQEVNKLIKENKGMEIDVGDFVNELVEAWDIDQLIEYAQENLYDFYSKHPDILEKDYEQFMEDNKAHHVLGY